MSDIAHIEGNAVAPVMGRPTVMTEEVKAEVLARMMGGESVLRICADAHMPDKSTLYRYLAGKGDEHADFRDRYHRALVFRTYALAEETLAIADDSSEDWDQGQKEDGTPFIKMNPDAVQRSKLRVATRQWHIERLQGVRYGRPAMAKEDGSAPDEDKGVVVKPIRFSDLPDIPPRNKRMPTFERADEDDITDVEPEDVEPEED